VIKNYAYNTFYELIMILSPLITTPYVSRILGAGGVGIYSYARSFAAFFILVGGLGTTLYGQREIAYVQNDPEKRTKVFWEIELFRIILTFICTALFLLVFGRTGENRTVYIILSLEILASAFDISWFFRGIENFKITVLRSTLIKLSGIVFVFAFVKKAGDVVLYTLCLTIPFFLGNLCVWPSVRKYLSKIKGNPLADFGRHIKPMLVLFVPQIAVEVYEVLDKTMIGAISSDMNQVGCYTQAQKLIRIVLMIVTSLGTVMLSAMSAAFADNDQERIKSSIKNAFRFVYMISFALAFGLCGISERFVPFFLGPGFDLVGPITVVTSPILVIIGISNVIGKQYLLPTKQQGAYTVSVVIGAIVNVISNFILIHLYGAIGAAVGTVIAEITVASVEMYYVRNQLPLVECLTPMFKYCVMGIMMFLAVWGVGKVLPSDSIYMIVMIAMGGIVYGLELLVTKDEMLWQGIDMIKGKLFKRA
jgi:O-antigen/teichoic acid export membrane protein